MTDRRPDHPAHASENVSDLVANFLRHRDALRAQANELARLRADVLSAADREASGILATARAEIRQSIVRARHDLSRLVAQVQAADHLDMTPSARSVQPEAAPIGALQHARQDLRQALREATADLDAVITSSPIVSLSSRPAVASSPPIVSVSSRATVPDPPHTPDRPPHGIAAIERKSASSRTVPFAGSRFPRSANTAKAWVASFTMIGLLTILGAAWWVRIGAARVSREKATIVSGHAPGAPMVPLVVPVSAPPSSASEPAPRAPVSLLVEAQQPAWIRATVDGQADAGRILQAGETRTIDAAQEISLRVGNAGAVRVALNGAEPTVVGRDGEVVTRRFTVGATSSRPGSEPSPRGDGTEPTERATSRPQDAVTVRGAREPAALSAFRAAERVPASSIANGTEAALSGLPTARSATTAAADQAELTEAASRWLDAYYRQGAQGNSPVYRNVRLSDQRTADQRLPAGLANVRRTLESTTFQFAGEAAVVTARMTEQADVTAEPRKYVSWVSQIWRRESGEWHLFDVRLVANAALESATLK